MNETSLSQDECTNLNETDQAKGNEGINNILLNENNAKEKPLIKEDSYVNISKDLIVNSNTSNKDFIENSNSDSHADSSFKFDDIATTSNEKHFLKSQLSRSASDIFICEEQSKCKNNVGDNKKLGLNNLKKDEFVVNVEKLNFEAEKRHTFKDSISSPKEVKKADSSINDLNLNVSKESGSLTNEETNKICLENSRDPLFSSSSNKDNTKENCIESGGDKVLPLTTLIDDCVMSEDISVHNEMLTVKKVSPVKSFHLEPKSKEVSEEIKDNLIKIKGSENRNSYLEFEKTRLNGIQDSEEDGLFQIKDDASFSSEKLEKEMSKETMEVEVTENNKRHHPQSEVVSEKQEDSLVKALEGKKAIKIKASNFETKPKDILEEIENISSKENSAEEETRSVSINTGDKEILEAQSSKLLSKELLRVDNFVDFVNSNKNSNLEPTKNMSQKILKKKDDFVECDEITSREDFEVDKLVSTAIDSKNLSLKAINKISKDILKGKNDVAEFSNVHNENLCLEHHQSSSEVTIEDKNILEKIDEDTYESFPLASKTLASKEILEEEENSLMEIDCGGNKYSHLQCKKIGIKEISENCENIESKCDNSHSEFKETIEGGFVETFNVSNENSTSEKIVKTPSKEISEEGKENCMKNDEKDNEDFHSHSIAISEIKETEIKYIRNSYLDSKETLEVDKSKKHCHSKPERMKFKEVIEKEEDGLDESTSTIHGKYRLGCENTTTKEILEEETDNSVENDESDNKTTYLQPTKLSSKQIAYEDRDRLVEVDCNTKICSSESKGIIEKDDDSVEEIKDMSNGNYSLECKKFAGKEIPEKERDYSVKTDEDDNEISFLHSKKLVSKEIPNDLIELSDNKSCNLDCKKIKSKEIVEKGDSHHCEINNTNVETYHLDCERTALKEISEEEVNEFAGTDEDDDEISYLQTKNIMPTQICDEDDNSLDQNDEEDDKNWDGDSKRIERKEMLENEDDDLVEVDDDDEIFLLSLNKFAPKQIPREERSLIEISDDDAKNDINQKNPILEMEFLSEEVEGENMFNVLNESVGSQSKHIGIKRKMGEKYKEYELNKGNRVKENFNEKEKKNQLSSSRFSPPFKNIDFQNRKNRSVITVERSPSPEELLPAQNNGMQNDCSKVFAREEEIIQKYEFNNHSTPFFKIGKKGIYLKKLASELISDNNVKLMESTESKNMVSSMRLLENSADSSINLANNSIAVLHGDDSPSQFDVDCFRKVKCKRRLLNNEENSKSNVNIDSNKLYSMKKREGEDFDSALEKELLKSVNYFHEIDSDKNHKATTVNNNISNRALKPTKKVTDFVTSNKKLKRDNSSQISESNFLSTSFEKFDSESEDDYFEGFNVNSINSEKEGLKISSKYCKFILKDCTVNLSCSKVSDEYLKKSQKSVAAKSNITKLKRKLDDIFEGLEKDDEIVRKQIKSMRQEKTIVLKDIIKEIKKIKTKYRI